jgi:hypothetical protein
MAAAVLLEPRSALPYQALLKTMAPDRAFCFDGPPWAIDEV